VAAKTGKTSAKIEKELKGPDQFVSFWAKVGKQIGAHRNTLLLGVGAAIIAVLVVLGINSFFTSHAEKASADFAKIHRVASAPIVEGDKPAPADVTGPTFKSSKERAEAALKEVDAFLAAHGSSKLRDEALLQKGHLLLLSGRAAEAVTLYSGIIGDIDQRFRFLAEEGLAYAYEASGNIDKAIETSGALAEHAKGAGNFFRDRALFNKARLLESKGASKDAEKLYREILAEAPTSVLKEEINSRLALIESK
jgi:tetratricopeptide (TPR) repeat protein